MYKTKGKVNSYAFGTGEKFQIDSAKVIPWNKNTDKWYDLSAKDKKGSYDYTCARMTLTENYDELVKKLSNRQMSDIITNRLLVFEHVPRIDIPNAELVMIFHNDDKDPDRFIAAWISLDDLEKIS